MEIGDLVLELENQRVRSAGKTDGTDVMGEGGLNRSLVRKRDGSPENADHGFCGSGREEDLGILGFSGEENEKEFLKYLKGERRRGRNLRERMCEMRCTRER